MSDEVLEDAAGTMAEALGHIAAREDCMYADDRTDQPVPCERREASGHPSPGQSTTCLMPFKPRHSDHTVCNVCARKSREES